MTDFDAAAALLLLSTGNRPPSGQIDNENNNLSAVLKRSDAGARPNDRDPSSPLPKRRRMALMENRANSSAKGHNSLRIASVHQLVKGHEPDEGRPQPDIMTTKNSMLVVPPRLGSSSPDIQLWDSGRTSSPIILLQPTVGGEQLNAQQVVPMRADTVLYDSPGMNGFAVLLNSAVRHYSSSSPEPGAIMEPLVLNDDREKQPSPHHNPEAIVPTAMVLGSSAANGNIVLQPEEKSARSPSDSGVSSIHDEILPQNLVLKRWGISADVGELLPRIVQIELDSIAETSAFNKDLYTKTKMAQFPKEMVFNPNKSRIRKECTNDIDNQDRVKNNEASRRSRHKKKLMTQLMNTSLEYDRQENRQLYMEERWLMNMVFELEEKALSNGIDPQVLRKLRTACGFQ